MTFSLFHTITLQKERSRIQWSLYSLATSVHSTKTQRANLKTGTRNLTCTEGDLYCRASLQSNGENFLLSRCSGWEFFGRNSAKDGFYGVKGTEVLLQMSTLAILTTWKWLLRKRRRSGWRVELYQAKYQEEEENSHQIAADHSSAAKSVVTPLPRRTS